ncbi:MULTISPECIES: thiamine pyrophosphate-dependent dehydrogenase E1 component subunit alpha [Streptomyces]|uniref:thiamine pyrophosphate-dependent dehydrogenase E1 component subunit alpha n=1 Tax=Streptomyces TaxID=1883 RepID=UPI00031760DA|nr:MULTISPECIES: thiamine pyrophosphate-dependent dehydrogenase E1 component subunit alpha [Streptomyces]MCC3650679.1 thiamine pyrophosphate-dependent dehydrogenase E1 component subunit alpha [Streptomyces sp. S07_1.15]MZE79294.1 thiamine pyrophosphate-dependent dehydrogenase E1 component subunit alpha [Streptomyces sp. SID5475]
MSDTQSLTAYLTEMRRIRALEEKVAELRAGNDIVGSVHLCNGQEAIYVGSVATLDLTRDAVFPTYRGHGWAVACGVPMRAILAELLGRETGISGGRGGSAYFTAPAYGFYGENSIVGAGAPIAAGAALAGTYDGSGRVAVAAFGDGAMNQGAVHEAMNFASIRRLPVIFVVENNSYSELTPIADMVRVDQLFRRANAYGMTGAQVDGNDPVAVASAMHQAVARARRGLGPVLLEMMTQRLVGHYIGDVQHYRPEGELDQIAKSEPIVRIEARLRGDGVPQSALDQIRQTVADEVERAAAEALADRLEPTTSVLEHLYV